MGGSQGGNKLDATREMRQRADLRDYLAAERTLLAWIRTGLALMGFGFVVARFGCSCNNSKLFIILLPHSLTVCRCGLEPHSSGLASQ